MCRRIIPMFIATILIVTALNGCQFQRHDDPGQSELLALADHVLDITDMVCPVVEDSAPFRQKAASADYSVNKDRGTISLTREGMARAAQMSFDLVETGMVHPELQRVVDGQMPHDEIAAVRRMAGDEQARLMANQKSYSDDARAILASYTTILESVDRLIEIAATPGKNAAFYLQYSITRTAIEAELSLYCDAVDELGGGDGSGSPQYLASRERYLQHAADYMLSPAHRVIAARR